MQFIEFPSWGTPYSTKTHRSLSSHVGVAACGRQKWTSSFFTAHSRSTPPPAGSALVARVLALFLHAALHVKMPQTPEFTIAEVSATSVIAQGLGYVVGAGSLLLYTPIAIRVCRQRDASGLTLSTWWLKLISYTCSDVYSFANGYLVSTCVALVAALHTFPCSLEGT